jgi:hypothetical protein
MGRLDIKPSYAGNMLLHYLYAWIAAFNNLSFSNFYELLDFCSSFFLY